MTKQEIDQRLLDFAMVEAALWLCKIPKLERISTYQRIMKQVCDKFIEHHEELQSVTIIEVADLEFHVKVNHHVYSKLILERKGVARER